MRFYFVDKITEFKKGSSISGIKNISMTEPFFTFHFQRYPVMPGVLIIESLAQLAGLMIEMSFEKGCYKKAILSIIDKTKIKFMARPGDQIIMNAVLENISESGAVCGVSAFIDQKLLCETRLTFALMDAGGLYDKYLEDERQALVNTLMRDFNGGGGEL
jgi:3-hydroxyacyl-[acyl-carrier-protein] dehydratase